MSALPTIPLAQITGLVLAGGRGTRMGGVDKGLQELHGKPLAQHVLERLAPQVGTLAINANRSLPRYATFGYPVWHDLSPDFPGPLAGLQAGLAHCHTNYLATAPCDAPLIPYDLVERLAEELHAAGADAAFVFTGDEHAPRHHPVCALLKRSTLSSLDQFLSAGERKMELWFSSLPHVRVRFPDDHAFSNINTGLDLQQLEQQQ